MQKSQKAVPGAAHLSLSAVRLAQILSCTATCGCGGAIVCTVQLYRYSTVHVLSTTSTGTAVSCIVRYSCTVCLVPCIESAPFDFDLRRMQVCLAVWLSCCDVTVQHAPSCPVRQHAPSSCPVRRPDGVVDEHAGGTRGGTRGGGDPPPRPDDAQPRAHPAQGRRRGPRQRLRGLRLRAAVWPHVGGGARLRLRGAALHRERRRSDLYPAGVPTPLPLTHTRGHSVLGAVCLCRL